MNSTVNERLKEIAKELFHSNINEMCKQCGIKQATMSNIVSGRMSKPSFEVIQAIVVGTKVNPQWLLTGEGPMLKTDVQKEYRGQASEFIESIIESINTGDPDEAKESVDMEELSSLFDAATDPALQRLFVKIVVGYSNKLRQIRELKREVERSSRQIEELEEQLRKQ